MKKKFTRITSLLLIFCLMFLFACEMPGNKVPETPEKFWSMSHEWKTEHLTEGNSNENGYYYMDDNNFLMYLDYATKQSIALCNKVGCKHNDYTCEAHIEGFPPYIFFYENKLCLITDDENGMHIFKCDLDGTNREEKLLLMNDETEKGNAVGIVDVLINGDDLYYKSVYQEPIEEAGGKRKLPIRAVRHVDLKKWTDEEIFRSSEFIGGIVGADKDGVLIYKKPEMAAFTKKDMGELEDEKNGEFVRLLTLEEMQEIPVEVFYWDKKTGNKLIVYQSDFRSTWNITSVNGNCLYRMGRPNGFNNIGFEKIDMQTGKYELLRHDKENEDCGLVTFGERNGKYYLTMANHEDETWQTEIYTKDDFQPVILPFLNGLDSVLFEDEHGYIVDKVLEYRPDSEYGSVVATVFVPTEETDKKNPEYVMLISSGE